MLEDRLRSTYVDSMAKRMRSDKLPVSTEIIDGQWQEALEHEHDRTLSYEFIKSRIVDVEELLHYQRLWLRVGRVWLTVGNAALLAVAILTSISGNILQTKIPSVSSWSPYLYIVFGISILASPFVVYRQYKKTRKLQFAVKRLNIMRRGKLAERDQEAAATGGTDPALAHQKRYRDDIPDLISQYRDEASSNRRVHNRFQATIIIGSVFASAITTASVSYSQARWFAVVLTAAVGLAAGFTGYFKFHERSFSAQQTADSIEREYEAVELRVGKYANKPEGEAYALFADTVERLRDEQNKRQQQLDQPAEVKREE